jgi:hypothetical protein
MADITCSGIVSLASAMASLAMFASVGFVPSLADVAETLGVSLALTAVIAGAIDGTALARAFRGSFSPSALGVGIGVTVLLFVVAGIALEAMPFPASWR